MKNNLLRTFFEWALITSVLMSTGFFVWYYLKSREVRVCNVRIASAEAGYQSNHAVAAMLLAECREYAKTNGDMSRLLDSSMPAPALPAAPASKPHGK
jgi:hypothetical protein